MRRALSCGSWRAHIRRWIWRSVQPCRCRWHRGGKLVLDALSSIQFAEKELHWFDSQMNTVLRALAPVVRDPALPTWMAECRWAVDGAAVNV